MNPRAITCCAAIVVAFVSVLTAAPPTAVAPMRTWTDASGEFTVQACLVKLEGKVIRLLAAKHSVGSSLGARRSAVPLTKGDWPRVRNTE